MDWLRRFIQADNHSAVDVGDQRQGTRTLKVQKPKFSEAFPESTIREGADELTFNADEVGTQGAFINTEHIELEKWGPRRAVLSLQRMEPGGKSSIKPSASQKAKALWAKKRPGTSVRTVMIQLAKISWAEQKLAWICEKNISKNPIAAVAKALECMEHTF